MKSKRTGAVPEELLLLPEKEPDYRRGSEQAGILHDHRYRSGFPGSEANGLPDTEKGVTCPGDDPAVCGTQRLKEFLERLRERTQRMRFVEAP